MKAKIIATLFIIQIFIGLWIIPIILLPKPIAAEYAPSFSYWAITSAYAMSWGAISVIQWLWKGGKRE